MDNADVCRELDKVSDVIRVAFNLHASENKANAALHMAATVRFSPLTVALEGALADLESLRANFE